ncbi:MAG: hypothetical protein KDD64_08370 [Bdellovibrionales bacterium]|nr:hypothetical protein [Bdellovibrionales bacterium]
MPIFEGSGSNPTGPQGPSDETSPRNSDDFLTRRLTQLSEAPFASISRLIDPERNFFIGPDVARDSSLLGGIVRQHHFLAAYKDANFHFSFRDGRLVIEQNGEAFLNHPVTILGVSESLGRRSLYSAMPFHEASYFLSDEHRRRSFEWNSRAERLLLDSLSLDRAGSEKENQPTGKDSPFERGFQVAALASGLTRIPAVPFGIEGGDGPVLKYWAIIETPDDYIFPYGIEPASLEERLECFRLAAGVAIRESGDLLKDPAGALAALAELHGLSYKRGEVQNSFIVEGCAEVIIRSEPKKFSMIFRRGPKSA